MIRRPSRPIAFVEQELTREAASLDIMQCQQIGQAVAVHIQHARACIHVIGNKRIEV
jgi:hypothetical protein